MIGVWVVLATLAAATAAGLYLRARNGRIRAAASPRRATGVELPAPVAREMHPETPVTLVQLSTTFCAPCRHTRAVLGQLAERTDGLRHVDLDVTEQPEVAHELGVLRTPTTLALAAGGRELLRIDGVPKGADVLEALRAHLPTPATPAAHLSK